MVELLDDLREQIWAHFDVRFRRERFLALRDPSPAARYKAASKRTDPTRGETIPVHSFHTLLADLATLTRNVVRLGRDRLTAILATPTKIQRRAFELLGVTIAV